MTSAQRVIKYLAIALAAMIIFSIASAAMSGIALIANIFSSETVEVIENGNFLEGSIKDNIETLDIDVSSLNVWIKKGETFRFETNNESVKSKSSKNKLSITQDDLRFPDSENNSLIIYIPENTTLKRINLDSVAGNVLTENIIIDKIDLDVAAGELKIVNCNVNSSANIECGLGKAIVSGGRLNNLDIETGMGKLELTAKITGKSSIECGIGEANINLKGKENTYKISFEQGIGSIFFKDKSISGDYTYGDGENIVNIETGIGKVSVDFVK